MQHHQITVLASNPSILLAFCAHYSKPLKLRFIRVMRGERFDGGSGLGIVSTLLPKAFKGDRAVLGGDFKKRSNKGQGFTGRRI